ncbi:MAG: GHKL domain-containing protein [Acidobacteria bacterium]|nr:GHKL domain-containing protein [Acidobacteriota bacterium]
MNQLFMNLLLNAIEAIRRGPGSGIIRVRTRRHNDRIRIEIEDTGCGIPPEKLDRIFDPNFTNKGVRMGAGFGLAICYQIVRAHHGTIEAESRPGEGARFTVTLPVSRAA